VIVDVVTRKAEAIDTKGKAMRTLHKWSTLHCLYATSDPCIGVIHESWTQRQVRMAGGRGCMHHH